MTQTSDGQTVEKYRNKANLKQAEFARQLGISRQRLHSYVNDISAPDVEIVTNWFLYGANDLVREMALEILMQRAINTRPCVCKNNIGDNGPCPRHMATITYIENSG